MESNITRDHIALVAMEVLMKASVREKTPFWIRIARWFGRGKYTRFGISAEEDVAENAYRYADAMIAEREKK